MPKQPSFAERTKSMRSIANNLLATADLLIEFSKEIDAEAARMEAAQVRFAERHTDKRERRAR
jgi:hypothetical protein